MSYYFACKLSLPFDEAIPVVKHALEAEGFGVLSEIDVSATLKKKIGVDFRPYRILGACNPGLAYQALVREDKIGTMLPCNVVVQDAGQGHVEIAAIDPIASMQAVHNPALGEVAGQVQIKLAAVIERLCAGNGSES